MTESPANNMRNVRVQQKVKIDGEPAIRTGQSQSNKMLSDLRSTLGL
jgi:hypothetical protein